MKKSAILLTSFFVLQANLLLAQSSSTFNADSLAFIPYYGSSQIIHFEKYLVNTLGEVYDVSTPSSPALISSFSTPPGAVSAYCYVKPYLYVGTGSGSGNFQIVSMSYPPVPNPQGVLSLGTEDIFGIAVQGKYAFLALGNTGVVSVDISDPTSPTLLDTIPLTSQVRDIAVHECHAFVSSTSGFTVLDISSPGNMVVDGTHGWGFKDLDHYGDTVFVCNFVGGFEVIDCSNPSSPTPISAANINDQLLGITFRDGMIYASSFSGDMYAFSLSYPTSILYSHFIGNAGRGVDVQANDSLVFLSSEIEGIHILQLDSSAASPNFPPNEGPCSIVNSITPENEVEIQVFPNPGRGSTQIHLPRLDFGDNAEVQIYNAKGKVVLTRNEIAGESFKFDSRNWPLGMYFYRIQTNDKDNEPATGSFLVQ